MTLCRTARTVALALSVACVAANASAQRPQPAKADEPSREEPSTNDRLDVQGGPKKPAMPRDTPGETNGLPDAPTVGTTTTTAAEPVEATTAERERTVRPNAPMLVTGATLFAVPYVAGLVVAAQSDLDADKRNYVPVLGPWLDLGQRPCAFGSGCTTGDNVASALLTTSGVVQGAGVLVAIASFFVPQAKIERAPAKAAVRLAPMSFPRGGGLGAVGVF